MATEPKRELTRNGLDPGTERRDVLLGRALASILRGDLFLGPSVLMSARVIAAEVERRG